MTELRADQHQAIYFYDGLDVGRQMLIEEFESVLDGFIPLIDYIDRQLHCAYAVINADLSLEAAVFFTLGFDATGRPDIHWNTPIRQLSRQAGYPMKTYPDVRVCCYSSCSISWHQQKLWQPEVEHMESLQHAVKQNSMQLGELNPHRVATREIPTLSLTETQTSIDSSTSATSLNIITENDNSPLPASARLQKLLESQKMQMRELEMRCSALTEKLSHVQDNIELRLQGRVQALRKKLELKWIDVVRLREADLVKSRKVLNDTRDKLNAKQKLDENGIETALSYREIEGTVLSIQHPGFPPVTIEAENITNYLKGPQQFVADKLGVELIEFNHWLNHFNLPCCVNISRAGATCGVSVDRVNMLSEFVSGKSDRCDRHKNIEQIKVWVN